ncbi:uncharacterized protein RCO7_09267 [Rhynchosporium graminicola]|uniref:Amidase domain-containing protein n=1 Tax=Rhynchosporium graminicola TaxID=2792576 RepID=A0A1E1KYD3_9HELO|nr:uncharacterized protein RCO7_09267 [Rhynchosporium commune]
MPGWSAVGGQAQSAYTFGDVDLSDTPLGHTSPSGSSTGSAVAVSAGFSPVALGTDTGGSLMTPSTRAAFDIRYCWSYGPSPTDLAVMLDVLVGPELIGSKDSYSGALTKTFRNLRIGVLRPEEWFFGPELQKPVSSATNQIVGAIADTNAAYAKLKHLAKSFKKVTLATPDAFIVNQTDSFYAIQTARYKATLEEYLQTLETSKVRTLDQLISFNPDHASHEMPAGYDNQDQLIAAAESDVRITV